MYYESHYHSGRIPKPSRFAPDTQKAIGLIKTIFQEKLCMALHLKRVTAPLFVMQGSGLTMT